MRETIADRVIDISTHDLTKRSTKIILWLLIWNYLFQLTTSRRGRLSPDSAMPREKLFQLTTSRRGRLEWFRGFHCGRYFNSRPHEEVDLSNMSLKKFCENFNSRPHEEVDDTQRVPQSPGKAISTHDLTKRSTMSRGVWNIPGIISTHDLTKRSTCQRIFHK